MTDYSFRDAADLLQTIEDVMAPLIGPVTAIPATELSGCHGHPLIRWSPTLQHRLTHGPGPTLDRPTLAHWETIGATQGAPPPPLQIVGFASTAPWRHAISAGRQLRGFGASCILTTTRPSAIKLSEADYAGVHVVNVNSNGTSEVLVRGRRVPSPPRMVATRYWEERLFAEALATEILPNAIQFARKTFECISGPWLLFA